MHEIVTLQFGNQANYLGTHFWNTQESYFTYGDGEGESPVNHDVLFRPGLGVDGSDTFMPRTVIYDLKGAFGSLKKVNALYELEKNENEREILWNNGTTPIKAEPIVPSAYTQALDAGVAPPALTPETVRYWSDYSRVYYHPRSLVQLYEYELQSQLQPFESWSVGEELFRSLDREHDLLDRDLRPFVEECDQLQGLQVLGSVDDAWGGFSARYVERLRDEFGKLSIWNWALEDEEKQQRDKQRLQLMNRALSLTSLIPTVSTYIPLPTRPSPSTTPSYLRLPSSSHPWHTAALRSTVLETATLPSRLRAQPAASSLAAMESFFNGDGNRRVVEARMQVANPHAVARQATERRDARMARKSKNGSGRGESTSYDFDHDDLEEEEQDLDHFDIALPGIGRAEGEDETPRRGTRQYVKPSHIFGRVETLRGPWADDDELAARNAAVQDRRWASAMPRAHRYGTPLLFPVLDSFPEIFEFDHDGGEKAEEKGEEQGKVAVRTALATTSALSSRLRRMGGIMGRMIGVEDREALYDGLKGLADEYEEGWDGDLESDDGDSD